MPIHLQLSISDGVCQAGPGGVPNRILAAAPLDSWPNIDQLRAHPYGAGLALFHTLERLILGRLLAAVLFVV